MKSKLWLTGYFIILVLILGSAGKQVYDVDPFFHYHKPDTDSYYYPLWNQRSQNDGISRHFDYNALITGTSMVENFSTSEMDFIFGTNSVKVPFAGGSYKEINDNLKIALEHNSSLKMIVRCLDMGKFFDAEDTMRTDLGKYPTYLYDDNPLNDVEYLFNKNTVFDWVYTMKKAAETEDFEPGITSFDDYSNWQDRCLFGVNTVCPDGISMNNPGEERHLTEEEKSIIDKNIYANVVSLAEEYPDVTFYYYFSPYSAAWWAQIVESGRIYRQIEAEEYIIEKILECDNIKLFSFNMRTDITTDLNNYNDAPHYAEWINSLILKWMYDGKYQLTLENYRQYIKDELEFYISYDYENLNDQEDYEDDLYAAALLNQELSGAEPVEMLSGNYDFELNHADILERQYEGKPGIICTGSLKRPDMDSDISTYLKEQEYIGIKFSTIDAEKYNYLMFYGKKVSGQGQPSIYVYDDQTGEAISGFIKNYLELDEDWHQYIVKISKASGNLTIIMNGGYIDCTGSEDSSFIFSNIILY